MTTSTTQDEQMAPPEPGVYPGVSFAQYAAAKGLNASLLKEGRKSMKHVRYYIDHDQPDTDTMRWGRVIHAALFEHSTFLYRFPVWTGGKRQGKEWEAFKAKHGGDYINGEAEQDRALEAAQAAVAHPLVQELIDEGKPEVSAWWHDHELLCKARMDWLRTSGGTPVAIVDLKTATDIHWFSFGRTFERLGYHISLGHYRRGMRILTGMDLPVYVIAMESSAPWDVVRVPVPDAVLDLGEEMAVGLMQQVAHCKETGHWPGRAETDDYGLAFPEHAMPDEEVAFDG